MNQSEIRKVDIEMDVYSGIKTLMTDYEYSKEDIQALVDNATADVEDC